MLFKLTFNWKTSLSLPYFSLKNELIATDNELFPSRIVKKPVVYHIFLFCFLFILLSLSLVWGVEKDAKKILFTQIPFDTVQFYLECDLWSVRRSLQIATLLTSFEMWSILHIQADAPNTTWSFTTRFICTSI